MHEGFLQHLWQCQKFDFSDLKSVQGEQLEILHPGHPIVLSPSCFFNALLIIDTIRWAGNVVVQVKSSDWNDEVYSIHPGIDNLIMLVVYEHDAKVYRKDGSEIQVLELKEYISKETFHEARSVAIEKIIKFVTVLWD